MCLCQRFKHFSIQRVSRCNTNNRCLLQTLAALVVRYWPHGLYRYAVVCRHGRIKMSAHLPDYKPLVAQPDEPISSNHQTSQQETCKFGRPAVNGSAVYIRWLLGHTMHRRRNCPSSFPSAHLSASMLPPSIMRAGVGRWMNKVHIRLPTNTKPRSFRAASGAKPCANDEESPILSSSHRHSEPSVQYPAKLHLPLISIASAVYSIASQNVVSSQL